MLDRREPLGELDLCDRIFVALFGQGGPHLSRRGTSLFQRFGFVTQQRRPPLQPIIGLGERGFRQPCVLCRSPAPIVTLHQDLDQRVACRPLERRLFQQLPQRRLRRRGLFCAGLGLPQTQHRVEIIGIRFPLLPVIGRQPRVATFEPQNRLDLLADLLMQPTAWSDARQQGVQIRERFLRPIEPLFQPRRRQAILNRIGAHASGGSQLFVAPDGRFPPSSLDHQLGHATADSRIAAKQPLHFVPQLLRRGVVAHLVVELSQRQSDRQPFRLGRLAIDCPPQRRHGGRLVTVRQTDEPQLVAGRGLAR